MGVKTSWLVSGLGILSGIIGVVSSLSAGNWQAAIWAALAALWALMAGLWWSLSNNWRDLYNVAARH